MKKNFITNKLRSLLLTTMLIVAMALTVVGCEKKDQNTATPQPSTVETEDKVLGEGQTKFMFTVVDKDGNETNFEIHTDKEIVGDALMDHELIAGDEGAYGLYVKTVNGITADFDVDGSYWAFYINGKYASTGVDLTDIKEGETYTFKMEK